MKVLFFILILLGLQTTILAQEQPSISIEDIKQIRKIIADRDFYKASFEEAKSQLEGWQKSSADWKNLYFEEKRRADDIQGKVIKECDASKEFLGKANFEYRTQADEDRRKISELTFEVNKLKSQRKWIFGAGAGIGLAAGGYLGFQAGKRFSF